MVIIISELDLILESVLVPVTASVPELGLRILIIIVI